MSLLTAVLWIAGLGALGGLAKSFIEEGVRLGGFNRESKVWTPGWIGHVIVGAIAALVVWCIYGPFSGQKIDTSPGVNYTFTFSQAAGSVLVGICGAEILQRLADKRADIVTKNNLAKALKEQIK